MLWRNVAAASNYMLTAVATDSLGAARRPTPVSIAVNALPMVAITWPTNRSLTNEPIFLEGTNVTLTVTNFDSDGSVSQVQIFWRSNYTNICIGTIANPGATPISRGATWWRTFTLLRRSPRTTSVHEAPSEILVFEVGPSNPPPYIAITWPTDGAGFGAGVDLAITAGATNAPQGGAVTNVEFFVAAADAGGESYRSLGRDPADPFTVTECNWRPGQYRLVARARDSFGRSGLSEAVQITVTNQAPLSTSGFWDPVFGNPGVMDVDLGRSLQGFGLAVAEDRTLYLAGAWMGQVDGMEAPYTAKWDGTNWFWLGNETNTSPATGYVVKPIGAQEVLFGAEHATEGLPKWDGTNWTRAGDGLNGSVLAIATLGSDVYIGGNFTQAGTNETVKYVARLEGTNWVAVGHGLNDRVNALAVVGGALYAGGDFTGAGTNGNVSYLARLDGTNWAGLGNGVTPAFALWPPARPRYS